MTTITIIHIVIMMIMIMIIIMMMMMMIIRPISLLTLSLLTLLESNFPGTSLGNPYGPGKSTANIKIMLESNPLKSTMSVGRLGVILLARLRAPEDGHRQPAGARLLLYYTILYYT